MTFTESVQVFCHDFKNVIPIFPRNQDYMRKNVCTSCFHSISAHCTITCGISAVRTAGVSPFLKTGLTCRQAESITIVARGKKNLKQDGGPYLEGLLLY